MIAQVMLVEPNALLRGGLRALINAEADLQVAPRRATDRPPSSA